jgi:hypothetical protein
MRRGARKGLLVLAIAALSVPAALTLPHLLPIGERGPAPDPSLADEPVGNLPGVRYEAVPDVAPPSAHAQASARRAALAHPAVTRGASRAHVAMIRPYGPFRPGEVPARDPCAATACLTVTVYLYASDSAIDLTYDPARDRVVRVEPSSGPPPLSEHERGRAHTLAEADPDVLALVRGEPHRHPAILTKPMWPAGVCDRHRCGTVIFTFGDLPETGIGRQLNVVVDLSANAIVERRQITCMPECRVGWER